MLRASKGKRVGASGFGSGKEHVSAARAGERKNELHRQPRTKQRQAGTFQVERKMKAFPAKRPRRGPLRFRQSVFANTGVSAWARRE